MLTEHDNKLIEIGLGAEKLSTDPFFVFVMNEMANAYMQNIVSSAPGDATGREFAYNAIKALQDINGTLSQMVQAKENIMAALAAAQDDE